MYIKVRSYYEIGLLGVVDEVYLMFLGSFFVLISYGREGNSFIFLLVKVSF